MTLRIDLDKSPSENVIDLIVYSNKDIDLVLNPSDYMLESFVCTEEPGYNTIIQITAVEDAFYTGNDWLYYNRVDLDSLYYRDYDSKDLEFAEEEDFEEILFDLICADSMIMKSQVRVKDFLAPTEEEDGFIIIVSDPDDLLYMGELNIPVNYLELDILLQNVILNTQLFGLNYPLRIVP